MNILGLSLLIIGAIVLAGTVLCAAGYVILTVMEVIEGFMKRYFPQKYYYDYEDEV